MNRNVLNYLDDIVMRNPEKTAFSGESSELSFSEVNDISRTIGTYLHQKGIYKKPVVVFMRRSPEEIATFLGVIAGGCYYVPIDEEMPKGRMELILDYVKSPLILCDQDTKKVAEQFQLADCEVIRYDEVISGTIDMDALKQIRKRAIDIDPIYIVYTSGSTGIPKGVIACHRSVIDYIEQLSEVLEFGEDTVFGSQSPLYFDACLKEIYPTLKFGATTYLIPKQLFSLPLMLVEYLNAHKINTICWVVSALTMISAFSAFDKAIPRYLHTVAFGSEVFPVRQFNIWKKALPKATFINLYGPTETTGMCCYYKVPDRLYEEGEVIPVGRPFDNREIILLNENDKPAEAGEQGEICIRGTNVTLGYYNDFYRTTESFVQNPLNTSYPEIIYRTGDIGRYNEEGELIYISRKDYQIKHMGHRIELGEIEANADSILSVRMSACVYDEEHKKIILFYDGDISEVELMENLKEKLPRYMMPAKVVKIEEIPFTANGKIDRRGLLKLI